MAIRSALEQEALRQLSGVGDPSLGEWREWTGRAFHVRRRLTGREQQQTGPAADIRRTEEAWTRAAAVTNWLHLAPAEVLIDELGDPR